jgi:hypothetical protein
MKTRLSIHIVMVFVFVFTASMGFARDYIIYSIVQDVPMGTENEIVKKNFYVNMGSKQGVKKGTQLDVFRTISRLDPYETKKRYNYKVKIGELKVLHTEDNTAIGALNKLSMAEDVPLFDINNFMIGDKVNVHIKK